MTLEGGNAVKGTGLAGAIARARRIGYPKTYTPGNDPLVNPESAAIVEYLVVNGLDDKKVKNYAGDLYPGYLPTKLKGGDNVSLELVEDGGVSKLQISATYNDTSEELDAHIADTDNPHSVTKAQVSLTNVTDDAQLKRADGDFNTFSEKASPVASDVLLLEDSAASYAKKKVLISSLGSSGITRSGATTDNALMRWNGTSADSAQNSSVICDDSGILSAHAINFGSASNTAMYNSGTITVNWSTCKPIQSVSVTGNVTTVSMTAPSGLERMSLLVTASGGSWSLTGFSDVKWIGRYNPDVLPIVIKSGYIANIQFEYNGSIYVGKIDVIVTADVTPSIVGTSTAYNSSGSSSFSFTYPAGLQSGDIAVMFASMHDNRTVDSYPSGFELLKTIRPYTYSNNRLMIKSLNGTESGDTASFTLSSSTDVSAVMFVVRGPFLIPYSSVVDECIGSIGSDGSSSNPSQYCIPSAMCYADRSLVLGFSSIYYTSAASVNIPDGYSSVITAGNTSSDQYISVYYDIKNRGNYNSDIASNSNASSWTVISLVMKNYND